MKKETTIFSSPFSQWNFLIPHPVHRIWFGIMKVKLINEYEITIQHQEPCLVSPTSLTRKGTQAFEVTIKSNPELSSNIK